MKSSHSLALAMIAGAMLVTSTSLRAADADAAATPALTADNTSNNPFDYYRSSELSVEGFGTASLGKYALNHVSDSNIRHDARLGAGAGINYFFTRNIGIGVEGYSENTTGAFIDSASANLTVRFPLGQSGFAPYAFGGGGRQFDVANVVWFGQAGAGMEYRFTPHIGVFIDARGVVPDHTKYYGVARLGMRFAF
jgi:hypothetical protein